MNLTLKEQFRVSRLEDRCLSKLQEYCGFSNQVFRIPVINKPLCKYADCHNNVIKYVKTYGGERIVGYYLITNLHNDNYGCAIYHSIWRDTFGNIIDITPFEDGRNYNIFTLSNTKEYYSGIVYDGTKYYDYT